MKAICLPNFFSAEETVIEKPTACIVTFLGAPGRPIYYEVVIDPRSASPSGRMLRMDASKGCEIHGWQEIGSLVVVEVLKEFEPDEFDAMTSKVRPA
jgi:hypothetical protein